MSLRIKAANIATVKDRPLFFDTNILLYLFGGSTSPTWVTTYNTVFTDCLKNKNILCTDVLVLSEFINRCLRFEYDKYLKKNMLDRNNFNYKQFRSTSEGKKIALDIEQIVRGTILKHFKIIGKLFNYMDIFTINLVNSDFNDELLIKICEEHQCVLVTNDVDFSGAKIDILSANNKLV